jgi:hypothetical protein
METLEHIELCIIDTVGVMQMWNTRGQARVGGFCWGSKGLGMESKLHIRGCFGNGITAGKGITLLG